MNLVFHEYFEAGRVAGFKIVVVVQVMMQRNISAMVIVITRLGVFSLKEENKLSRYSINSKKRMGMASLLGWEYELDGKP